MIQRERVDASQALSSASRATRQVRAASRWFPSYMLVLGILAFAVIVAVEVYFQSGIARFGALAAWALATGLVNWWAESQEVHPKRTSRRVWILGAIWFGGYLFVIGPIVRWQADDSLLWWSIASLVLASPFLIEALREWRRS